MPHPRIMNVDDELILKSKIAIAQKDKAGYANMSHMLRDLNLIGKGKLYFPWLHTAQQAPNERPGYAVTMPRNLRGYIQIKTVRDDIRWSPLEEHASRVKNVITHERNHRVNHDEMENRYRTYATTGDSMELEMFVLPRSHRPQPIRYFTP